MGESGCGKTTLGRAILGLIPVFSGNVIYRDGTTLSSLKESQFRKYRSRLQIIFQDPFSSLNPRLNIEDLIMEGLRVHFPDLSQTEKKNRIIKTLDLTGLPASYLTKFPHELSGGQRQRIGIARSLVLEPEFIVCDESVSALDVSIQAQIINLLIEIQDSMGIAYLFISHDLSVVAHISHEIAVMDQGRIIEHRSASEVMSDPKHPVTKKLIDAIPVLS